MDRQNPTNSVLARLFTIFLSAGVLLAGVSITQTSNTPWDNTFSITTSAQSYSEVSGVLGGFAFAAIVWLLERRHDAQDFSYSNEEKQAFLLLFTSFTSNLIASILWGLVAGETNPNGTDVTIRAAAVGLYATLVFATAAILTLEAIIFLITLNPVGQAYNDVLRGFFYTGAAVGFLYLWNTSAYVLSYRGKSELNHVNWILAITIVLFLGILLSSRYLVGRISPPKQTEYRQTSFLVFVWVWLLSMFISILAFAYVGRQNIYHAFSWGTILPANILWAILVGWATTLLPYQEKNTTSASTSSTFHQA